MFNALKTPFQRPENAIRAAEGDDFCLFSRHSWLADLTFSAAPESVCDLR